MTSPYLAKCYLRLNKVGSKWSMSGKPVILVDRESATHGRLCDDVLPLNRDHSDLVKFSRGCQDYEMVSGLLRRLVNDAPGIVGGRF